MSGRGYTVPLPRQLALMPLRGWLLLLILCSLPLTVRAAPAGYSTYYVPGDEANLADVFEDSNAASVVEDHNGYTKPIRSIIGISSWADDVRIYIDHWEDGYEFDPDNPSTADESCPVQSMGNTLVLVSIDVPSLNVERTNLGNDCATAVDPCSTSITGNGCYYDGKDKIYVAGGAVTMNRAAMPESVAGIQPAVVQAIAWEVYPVQPQLTTYILPFGENLGIDDFDRTEALVQATGDNTVVQIDFDGDGTYDAIDVDMDGTCDGSSVTLNEGETLRVARESDGDGGTGCNRGSGTGLDMGAVILGSDTIQVQYVGSEPAVNIEIRGFSAFPRGFWDDQYYAPVGGHTTGQGTDIFLHNPNGSVITIDYETNSGSGSFTIGANNTVSFAATEGLVPNNTAVYLGSRGGEVFWGVSSIDQGNRAYDWGYSLVPAYLLEDDFFIGWAPANSALPPAAGDPDAGGIFVAAAQDNIRLFVDYDADGTVDSTYSLNRLESLYLCDVDNSANCNTAGNTAPENDADMSGARIYATGPFTAAYGQNPNTANDVTGFDLGYTTLPSAGWIDLVLGVTKVTDQPTLGTGTGIVAKYTINVTTDEFSVEDVTVVDTLDMGWGYCTGTDAPVVGCIGPLITFPDLTTSIDAPSIAGQDLTWGSGEFAGGQLDMATNRTLTIEYYTYTTAIHADGQISISPVEASATRSVGVPTVTQTFKTSDKVFHLYTTSEMTVTKSSGGVDPLNPGDQFTYTVTVTNPGSTPLTDIAIYDPLPDGLGYVASSSQVTQQSYYKVQATEYYLGAGDFTGTTYDLTLDADLADNYFVIIQGSDGDGTVNGTRGPDENYVSLTADPFGSGDLMASGATDRISITRQNGVDDWVGVVTVVESLADHTGGGFTLHDVQRVVHLGAGTAGTDTTTAWSSIGQVMLMGGFNGAGCDTGSTVSSNTKVCHARIWPSGSDTINWSRNAGGATLSTATSTVMVLEWGGDWTVQRVQVTGNNGGDGANVTGEYNTAVISSVVRDNTWVWGTGHTNDGGIGDAAEAVLVTLGDGVNENVNETSVAVGIEYSGNDIDFEVYALTHANLAVDYQFKTDGDQNSVTVDVAVDNAGNNTRMALGYNGQNGTGTAYPRPMFSARYTADNTVRLERRRSGQNFPAWVEGIDFSGISHSAVTRTTLTTAGDAPSFVNAADGYSVDPGQSLTLTFDAIVDDPLATGIESATNTAYVTSAEIPVPVSGSATNIINNPSTASSSVGDFAWFDVDGDGVFDVGEPGLSNVEMTLKDQFGTPVAVTTTDTAGRYGFSGVSAGTGYYVQVTAGLAAGLVQSAPAGRSDDQTDPFDLTAGANYTGADLGYTSAAGTATLGDLLWSDADGDGLHNAGEPGLGGITVELWLDVDGDGVFEPTGDDSTGQQSTTTTAADGSYLFTGVTASGTEDYFVYVNASQPALTGYIPTRTVIYYAANMSGGDVDLSADFGFQGVANTYSITDRIWADDDADQDDDNPPTNNAEAGISGVTVVLKDLSGTIVASGSSDSNGYFTFSGVPAGSYVIAITDTAGKLADHYGTTSEAVAGEFTVVGLSANIDYSAESSEPHFGYNLTKTVGDTVFNDINNNASQDVGEPGMSGVTVELWLDDGDFTFEPGGDDSLQGTAITDASGNYLFSGLADGFYFVHVDSGQAVLAGLNLTTTDSQPLVGGHQLQTNIISGANNLDLDFGYRSPDNRAVGGLIWDDTDQAGDITAGESGIEGVTVDLLRGVTVIATITTLPSTEVIDGYIDIDGGGVVDAADDGSLLGVTVINGALDVNNNGTIDAGDDGSFAGISVIDGLLDMNGDVTVDAGDDGDLTGRYQFSGLQSDTYTARITDTSGVLGDYTTTYEKTEGTTAPFDYEESVDVTGGSVTDIHFGLYSVMTATFALISDFQAFFEGGQTVVEWRTLSEQGTVGFHLERLDKEGDQYKRLNKRLLPGLLYSRHGGTYRYADPGARVGGTYTYQLVEVEATGNTITYGPYTLTVGVRTTPVESQQSAVERPVPGFERVARPMSALEQARIAARHKARDKAKWQKHQRKGPMAKIQVREDGLYYLDAAELANLFALSESKISKLIERNRLRLTNHGKQVATLAVPDNAGLYFYGQAIDIPYTQDNIYWLSKGKGLRMAEANGRTPEPVTGQTFQAHVHAEIDQYAVTNLFQDPDADYWMWDYLMPNFGRDSLFFTVASPAAVGTEGTATLVVRLQGGSEAMDGQDHHALVRFNGADIGEIQWDGLAAQELILELPLDLLNDGDNTVEVAGVLEAGVPYSLFYVNEFALSYPRSYASENNHLEVDKAGHKTLSIGGFGSEHIMALDISNPNRPRLINKTTIDGTDDNYRVSFRTKGNADRYLALTHDAAAVPESLVVDIPSRLKKRHQVDYLIITSSDLVPAAEELANYRQGQGLRTMVADIEDVYDEFSFGLRNPGAIRAFLRYAYNRYRPGPRYVVLVGEGSYDYKDHMGFGDAIIPTPLTPTPDGLFPSDNLYVDVEGYDWIPEMAVGRLPVINAEELTAFLAKLQAYEAGGGAWESQAILAADAPDNGGDFPTDSENLGALFPPNYVIDRLYLDTMPIADARQQLIDGLNGGRAFVNFIGHGSIIGLGNSGLLTSGDVAALNNAERLPVLTALTCLAGHFAYPGFDAIAENLVIKPDGGAIAVWAPSSLSKNKRSNILGRGFYEATFQDGELVLGEALLKAQTNYARDGIDKYLLDTYNLIGDPATIMK